jgi:glycosyltransferase involved in cell wall biosynthesis
MEPLITFIIPTIGRSTIYRTIQSLQNLNNKNWNAIIIFDGIDPTVSIEDERIKMVKVDKVGYKNCAGEVRNFGMQLVKTNWIGFVDDDDILLPNYIDALLSESVRNPDVIIFRMVYNNLDSKRFNILTRKQEIVTKPAETDKTFKAYEVGISFCMKSSLVLNEGFKFQQSHMEDFYLLESLKLAGKNIIISKAIAYVVRPD